MTETKILELPILPLRNTVIFPSGITPLTVGRPLSLAGAEAVLHLIVQGQERYRIIEFTEQTPHLKARVEILPEPVREKTPEVEALQRNIQVLVQKALGL